MLWREQKPDLPPFLPQLFEDILGESPAMAMALSREWRNHRQQSSSSWHVSRNLSSIDSIPISRKVTIHDEEPLQQYLTRSNSGILLMTIHMGDYLQACLQIFSLIRNRKVVILRRNKPDEDELRMFRLIENYGHKLDVVYHNHASVRHIIRSLRNGAIVTVLHDLSQTWGRVVEVEAFGRKLQWASGPVEIAMHGRSTVLPFHCFAEGTAKRCQFGEIRDYRLQHNRPSREIIAQEVQHFVTQSACYIKRYASQWHHWPLIPEMIAE